ncbi:hypothetical protein U1872_06540 [Sphingomonas sp. RB3P16]
MLDHTQIASRSKACTFAFEIRGDDSFRGFGDDRVAIGAQSSHAAGSAMSQRECAGFNWPPLSIPAEKPVSRSPWTVSRAGLSRTHTAAWFSVMFGVVKWSDGCRAESVVVVVVGHPDKVYLTCSLSGRAFEPHRSKVAPFQSLVVVVVVVIQELSIAKSFRSFDLNGFNARFACPPPDPSLACGVGQLINSGEPETLSDVRRPDARSAQIDRPAGVIRSFQVSLNKVEPTESVLARNLFSKDVRRAALLDEIVPSGP